MDTPVRPLALTWAVVIAVLAALAVGGCGGSAGRSLSSSAVQSATATTATTATTTTTAAAVALPPTCAPAARAVIGRALGAERKVMATEGRRLISVFVDGVRITARRARTVAIAVAHDYLGANDLKAADPNGT